MPTKPNASAQTILYFCYGPDRLFDQTLFSILSLLRQHPAPAPFRIAVYTDKGDRFAGLPVEIVLLDAALLDAWMGGSDYIHRRKTCAIDDALSRFGGKVVFVDSDTYFTGSALTLFARVGPGRACFHICEGYLSSTGTVFDVELYRQLTTERHALPDGTPIVIGSRTPMWNTGIVGIDASDRALVLTARDVSDEIWRRARPEGAYGKKIHHAEQFAMGYAFRHSRLSEGSDVLYHYWPTAAKQAFGAVLREQLAGVMADPSPRNIEQIYARRYRQTGLDNVRDGAKMALRAAALKLGVRVKGVRRSVG